MDHLTKHLNHPDKSKGFYEVRRHANKLFHVAEGTPMVLVRCLDRGKSVRNNISIGAKGSEARIVVSWALAKAVACGAVELMESTPKELKPMLKEAERLHSERLAKQNATRKL